MELSSKFDSLMHVPEIELVIHDLVGGNARYIDSYLEIYEALFPQYSRYTSIMRLRAEKPSDETSNEKWHQWLLVVCDKPVGIIGFLYNKKRNTGILLDFAILPNARDIKYENRRLAHLALNLAMRQLIVDAQEQGCPAPLCMIAEVEPPALVKRYVEYGFVEFPIEYFEPPFTTELVELTSVPENLDKIGYERMNLGAFQIPGHPFGSSDSSIIEAALITMLKDHYSLSDDHWLVQKLIKENLK